MPLKIALQGSHYRDGRLVLMGKPDSGSSIDAALLLTSLRLACGSVDPLFSLDPDYERSAATTEASDEVWRAIADDLARSRNVNATNGAFSIRTIWARRDYPKIWTAMESRYPDIRSKLRFNPPWLAETRFGEIFFKADVLLKELFGGVAVLQPGSSLRASEIDSYASATSRHAARSLFASYEGKPAPSIPRSHKIWFELTPGAAGSDRQREVQAVEIASISQSTARCRAGEPNCQLSRGLRGILNSRNLLPTPVTVADAPALPADGDALDLSNVFPRVFIRGDDRVLGGDLGADESGAIELSGDINRRIRQYAGVHKELQELVDVVRSYVVAVYIARQNLSVCSEVRSIPMLPSERATSTLPTYHPVELFLTVATYEASRGGRRVQLRGRASGIYGGVSSRAAPYIDQALKPGASTAITRIINDETRTPREEGTWEVGDSQRFVALLLGTDRREDVMQDNTQVAAEVRNGELVFVIRLNGQEVGVARAIDPPKVAARREGSRALTQEQREVIFEHDEKGPFVGKPTGYYVRFAFGRSQPETRKTASMVVLQIAPELRYRPMKVVEQEASWSVMGGPLENKKAKELCVTINKGGVQCHVETR